MIVTSCESRGMRHDEHRTAPGTISARRQGLMCLDLGQPPQVVATGGVKQPAPEVAA